MAHGSCNGDKSDLLAGEKHLVPWLERNEQQGLATRELLVATNRPQHLSVWCLPRKVIINMPSFLSNVNSRQHAVLMSSCGKCINTTEHKMLSKLFSLSVVKWGK